MKLFIINGENKNDEKLEIHLNENSMVIEIKYKLDEILHGNGNFTRFYFKLIHKNIILVDADSIKCYKICENDEIWFGKIESYLRKDDVVVDVFHKGLILSGEYLIVKMSDTISTIKSIIERIHSEIINIWNADGKQMKNDQIVTEIDTNENYQLIIRCDDGKGNEIDNTFDQCCFWHSRYYVDQYLFWDKICDDNKNESIRLILIDRMNKIRKIILSNDTIDDKLNENFSNLPSSFFNSTNLFCRDMADRIVHICNDYWRFFINQYGDDVVRIFGQYYPFAIIDALWDYSSFRQHNTIKTNKTISSIVIDALDYFVKYLIDSSNDWRYWLRLFMNQYCLRSFSDSDLNERIDKCAINKFTIKMRINGNFSNNFFPYKPETIFKAKQSISNTYNVDMKHLYCIKPGGDHKPNDEDKFDDEFIIEIVLNMNDIKVLRKLDQGAYAKIFLCQDKISNKQFILKKAIQNDDDVYRNINIYSKISSSINIMNYSGLFREEESICIGMEYMPGVYFILLIEIILIIFAFDIQGSLRSYLDKGKYLSEQEVVKISYEILTQINELHKLGIIHRDIKSDNIVLDEHNHAKLIDFGLSKFTIGLTSKYLLDRLKAYAPGTICYMAPELLKEEPYSEKIDIWSFGMVMVEMVTGKRPFHWLKIEVQAIPKIIDCTKYEFVPIFPISNELNQFIDSCLTKNPDERPNVEQLITSIFFL